jgi:hypothetical protein
MHKFQGIYDLFMTSCKSSLIVHARNIIDLWKHLPCEQDLILLQTGGLVCVAFASASEDISHLLGVAHDRQSVCDVHVAQLFMLAQACASRAKLLSTQSRATQHTTETCLMMHTVAWQNRWLAWCS